jgi:hypothetical protein
VRHPSRCITIYAEEDGGHRRRFRFAGVKGAATFLRYRVINWLGEYRALGHRVVFYIDGAGHNEIKKELVKSARNSI